LDRERRCHFEHPATQAPPVRSECHEAGRHRCDDDGTIVADVDHGGKRRDPRITAGDVGSSRPANDVTARDQHHAVARIDSRDPPEHGDGPCDDRLDARPQDRSPPEAGVTDGDGAVDDTTVDIDGARRQPEGGGDVTHAGFKRDEVEGHSVSADGPADADVERGGSVHGTGVHPHRPRSEK
jgi:hypothetical protein